MRTVSVKVKPVDIRRGKPGDPLRCPLSRAFERQGMGRVHVDRFMAYQMRGDRVRAATAVPPVATWFLDTYDAGGRVEPGEFEFQIPDDWKTRP